MSADDGTSDPVDLRMTHDTITNDAMVELQRQMRLLEQQLHLAQDKATEKVERVSHEIQIRLQGIIAEAENLITEIPSLTTNDAIDRLRFLLYASLALDTVTQTLMGDYLEEFYFTEEPIMVLLYEAKQIFTPTANRRGIEIQVWFDSEASLPKIEMSKPHLQQAINNLVHNAVKYSFRSGTDRHRYVRIEGHLEGTNYVLTFENYGVGIKPEEIARKSIFDEGYQGTLTRGEYRTGAGLGLAFTKKVIERHHGQIDVESRLTIDPALGHDKNPHLTRFIVRLPCRQPQQFTYDDRREDG